MWLSLIRRTRCWCALGHAPRKSSRWSKSYTAAVSTTGSKKPHPQLPHSLGSGALIADHVRLRRGGPAELHRAQITSLAEGCPAVGVAQQRLQRGPDAVLVRLGVGHRVPANLVQRGPR